MIPRAALANFCKFLEVSTSSRNSKKTFTEKRLENVRKVLILMDFVSQTMEKFAEVSCRMTGMSNNVDFLSGSLILLQCREYPLTMYI